MTALIAADRRIAKRRRRGQRLQPALQGQKINADDAAPAMFRQLTTLDNLQQRGHALIPE